MRLRRVIPVIFLLAVAGGMTVILAARAGLIDLPRRYDPFAVPDLDETPHWLTSTQLKLIDLEPANCQVALSRTGLPAQFRPTQGAGTNCERAATVQLSRLSRAKLRPEDTRCAIAARMYMWERHVIQPAAMRFFSEPVTEILHFGSYSCRTIAGSRFMSEHAKANAFDISGFRLKSGRQVSVLKDWPNRSNEQKFLHVVRDGACDYFNLVLSPDYNAAHADHFHVDMGWARRCN